MPHLPTRVTSSGQVLNEPALNLNFIHPRSRDGIKCVRCLLQEISVRENGEGAGQDWVNCHAMMQVNERGGSVLDGSVPYGSLGKTTEESLTPHWPSEESSVSQKQASVSLPHSVTKL